MNDLEECEAQAKGAKDRESVQHGENLARKVFEQSTISYDDVLEVIMKADIEPQKKRRACIEGVVPPLEAKGRAQARCA